MNRLTLAIASLTIGLSAALTIARTASAQSFETEEAVIQADILADGLDHPWGLDFLPNGDALITERPGTMSIFSQGRLSPPIEGLPPVAARGQGGLLDVAVAPDFDSTELIYFTYSEPGSEGAGTALARARLVRGDAAARLAEVETLFSMARKTAAGQHFGSRIVFNPDGTLFVTTGDRGDGRRAQDMDDHAGAVLRLNPDGSVPADNPYADTPGHRPEIWSKGHRNPQGAVWDPVTGALWTIEHGARGGDELNRPEAGRNYGWPVISYGRHYSGDQIGVGTDAEGYEQPVYYWDPSIAPSGLDVYDGDMFPAWKGDLLAGALKFALVSRIKRDAQGNVTGEERMFEGAFGRIRDVDVAPDGSVWLITDDSDGAIVRLSRGD